MHITRETHVKKNVLVHIKSLYYAQRKSNVQRVHCVTCGVSRCVRGDRRGWEGEAGGGGAR